MRIPTAVLLRVFSVASALEVTEPVVPLIRCQTSERVRPRRRFFRQLIDEYGFSGPRHGPEWL